MRRGTVHRGEPHAGDSLGQKTPRWELVLHEHGSHRWSWRRIGIDGSIEHAAGPYSDFGLAMGDAVKNGFCARDEDWAIKTQKWITHFPPGKTPFSVPHAARRAFLPRRPDLTKNER